VHRTLLSASDACASERPVPSIFAQRLYPKGYLYIYYLVGFGISLLTLLTLETYFELENFPSTYLLAWLLILVRLSEIQVHCIESYI
jgi:hypothetical protein